MSNTTKVWGITALLALIILGGAVAVVLMAQRNRAPAETAAVQDALPEPEMPPSAQDTVQPFSPQPLPQIPVPKEHAIAATARHDPPAQPFGPAAPKPQLKEEKAAEKVEPPVPAGPAPEVIPTKSMRAQLKLENLSGTLKLSSPAFEAGGHIPVAYTCNQSNISPSLEWAGAPGKTRSFVLFMERREPGKNPFVVWTLYGIGNKDTQLPENIQRQPELKTGWKQGVNDYNNVGYVGPCEPRGSLMNYSLQLFALDYMPALSGGASPEELINAMNGHIIDAAEFPFLR